MMAKMVEIKNVSKNYGNRQIFKDLSLDIEKGEFVSIVGPSGCERGGLC